MASTDKNRKIIVAAAKKFKIIDIRLWIAKSEENIIPTRRGFRFNGVDISTVINTFRKMVMFHETWAGELNESVKICYGVLQNLCEEYICNYVFNQLEWYNDYSLCSHREFDHGKRFLEFVDTVNNDEFLKEYEKVMEEKNQLSDTTPCIYGYKIYPCSMFTFINNNMLLRKYIGDLYQNYTIKPLDSTCDGQPSSC